ncbi:Rna recognition motif-containing protein [Cardiosporidium cionae]|uniref:Rna recognition motif-containing protein n=1 Tax=Cardiosporidium cionae TaxID=476202 RepID=A0ABQ7JGE4_9APIC|nr:Rna recognition motif-containing protein [Cardiosporidium cionae]|eukprot:KAF8823046.1 Rna recognition motif-containing protein [Cardiosporidium cionae]
MEKTLLENPEGMNGISLDHERLSASVIEETSHAALKSEYAAPLEELEGLQENDIALDDIKSEPSQFEENGFEEKANLLAENGSHLSCAPAPPVEIKLFCGRVPQSMAEKDIKEVFEAFGDVKEVIIIRDKESNNHKFSAFIRMASIAHADAAIHALNGQRTLDQSLGPLQVKYANGEASKYNLTDTTATEAGVHQAKVFVGSLTKNITVEEIKELFAPYGVIDEVFIMMDKATGSGKGCAFVKFAFKEQAIFAMRSLDGKRTLDGCSRPVEVRFAESKAQRQQQQQQQFNSFPGGSPPMMNPYGGMMGPPMAMMPGAPPGPPASATPRASGVWKEYWTQDGRAYYHNEQTQVTQWEKPAEFDQVMMGSSAAASASFGAAESTGPKGANIFIFYVPNEWTQSDLVSAFGSFGNIVSARIATDKQTGRNRGYAFVSYDNPQAAAYAVHHMNGYFALSKRLKVTIKKGEEPYVQHLLDQLVESGDQNRNSGFAMGSQAAPYGAYVAPRYSPY